MMKPINISNRLLQVCISMILIIIPLYGSGDILVGLEPAMTVEPWYEDGEFDLNLVPLVLQHRGDNSSKMRLVVHANYHFSDDGGGWSDLGIEVARPVYLFEDGPKVGAYVSPITSLGVNNMSKQFKSTVGGEFGYSFDTNADWRFNVAMQLGATYFGENKTDSSEWKNHFGIKFYFGKWFLMQKKSVRRFKPSGN